MKKNLIKLFALGVLLTTLLAGCSKDNNIVSTDYVGTWATTILSGRVVLTLTANSFESLKQTKDATGAWTTILATKGTFSVSGSTYTKTITAAGVGTNGTIVYYNETDPLYPSTLVGSSKTETGTYTIVASVLTLGTTPYSKQ